MIRAHWRGKVGVMAEPPAPLPLVEPPDWMADGLCAQVGGCRWDALTTEEQVEVCQSCRVRSECAQFGVDHLMVTEKAGTVVYGGMTPAEIVERARAQRRGEVE